jgi:peptidoglycan/xylan/chitin deacetylase (PgdA/CDA1 family)
MKLTKSLSKIYLLGLLAYMLIGCQANVDHQLKLVSTNTSTGDSDSLKIWLAGDGNNSITDQLIKVMIQTSRQIDPLFDLNRFSLILMPDRHLSQGVFKRHSATELHYRYHPDKLDPQVNQRLAYQLYLAYRQTFDASDSVLNQVVSQGLALHFIESVIKPNQLFQSVNVTDDTLNSQLQRLSQHQSISTNPATLGYHLVKRHFVQYPGSDASNTHSLNHQVFADFLTQKQIEAHKPYQFERTTNPKNQQLDKAFDWTGTSYKGFVFKEGWNHKKQIALTFDDGPGELTKPILDTLDKYQIKASFFWLGHKLHVNKALVLRAKNAGHTIANHSWDHPHGPTLSPEVLWTEQIDKANQAFKQVSGHKPRFYRPPFGEITEQQIDYIRDTGMKIIMWSIDPKDWNFDHVKQQDIELAVINNPHPQAISLMHDDTKLTHTLEALPAIIEHYQQQGYQFVTLEQLLGISDKY